MRKALTIILGILACAGGKSAIAGMIVNEAYSSVSSDNSTWIELYNDSDSNQVLNDMRIMSGGVVSQFPQLLVQPYHFVVLCDQLYGPGAFESKWGDSSGLWGDRSYEAAIMIVQMPLAPGRQIDSVVLMNADGTAASLLKWTTEDELTHSWERSPESGDSAVQCQFGIGGTPGDLNSMLPVENDLAIESLGVRRLAGQCEISIQVRNAGTDAAPANELVISESGGVGSDTLRVIGIPILSPGESISLTHAIPFSDTYYPAIAGVNEDERQSNNHKLFMIVGDDYPPVMLSEIMAAPPATGGGEWIELKRRADTAVNLQGWRLEDAAHSASISDSLLIMTDSLAVVAQSPADFMTVYGFLNVPVIDPASWVTLNNSGDIVRLVDPYGIIADSCRYYDIPIDGISIARDPSAGLSGEWHNSLDTGGTPGASNRVLEESASGPVLTATPQTISPDGDGRDEEIVFRAVASSAAHCTLRIFDRNGRVVRTLLANQLLSSNDIAWDGFGADGGRLPIGIYVALLEADGTSVRKAVVIAR